MIVDAHLHVDDIPALGEGVAELVERPNVGGKWVEVATRMSLRHLGEDGPKCLTPTLNQPRWFFRFKPSNVRTWQGVGWARRYWVEDSGGPTYEEAHSRGYPLSSAAPIPASCS